MQVTIVCRDLMLQSRIRSALRDLPLTVAVRGPGPDAGEIPDLRIIDLALGLEVLRDELLQAAGRPVIAFGPHVRTDLLTAARSLGAAAVLSHSALAARLAPTVTRLLQPGDAGGTKAE